MIAVYIFIGMVAGFIITFLFMNSDKKTLSALLKSMKDNNAKLTADIEKTEDAHKQLLLENTQLKTDLNYFHQKINDLKDSFNEERERLENRRIESEKNSEELRKENDRQWELKFEKLREEFKNIAGHLYTSSQESIQQNNRDQIGEMLNPIKEQFEAFRKSVEDSKTSNEVAKKELKDSFESTMKLFQQQQQQAVDSLRQETIRIGNDANNLTNALKRDTKKQGNWGEMILETLLENSGLEKNIHFFIQESVKDDNGKLFRPDVIVKFPEGKRIVIDSKVSLTAYTEAFETEDEEIRRRRLKDHARSVRRHVDELTDKNYDFLVKDALAFTLMFIPNDQCYLSALEEDKDLGRYAYSKGIVIISPSNLMIALQLAFHMWQQDARNKNIDNIVKTANELYDKVAGFSETLEGVDRHISQLNNVFQNAKKQLYEGSGNIFRRVENLKKLGITPKKQIKGLEKD